MPREAPPLARSSRVRTIGCIISDTVSRRPLMNALFVVRRDRSNSFPSQSRFNKAMKPIRLSSFMPWDPITSPASSDQMLSLGGDCWPEGRLPEGRSFHGGTGSSNPSSSSGESSTNLRALRKKEPRGSGAEEFFAARETNGSKGATRYLISVSAPSASARYGTTAALVSHAAALPAAVQQQPKRRSSSVLVHRSIRLQSSDRSQGANHAVDV